MTVFIVSVSDDRSSASYSVATVAEALAKAEVLAEKGLVKVIDQLNREYVPSQFQELQDNWPKA